MEGLPADQQGYEKHFSSVKCHSITQYIFTIKTRSAALNQALKRLCNNKLELLMVLERAKIPLHNNGAENAISEYVKKRKISGSMRSEAGRKCRDTFTSLKKTCRKLGVIF